MYKLRYHPRAVKFFKKLSQNNRLIVIKKLEALQKNPLGQSHNIKKLSGASKNSYRLRVGKIRIIYQIDILNEVIYISNADYRGSIYN